MLRPKSMIKHVSFVEFTQMINVLAYRVESSGLNIKGIHPLTIDDMIPAAHLAYKLNVPILDNTTKFSIYSDSLPDICMFKKNYESDLYNNDKSIYLETVDVSQDGYHQKVVFEWMK